MSTEVLPVADPAPLPLVSDVMVGGKPWAPTPAQPCRHHNIGTSDPVVHNITDPAGPGRRVVLSVMCLDCTEPLYWQPERTEVSEDRSKIGVWFAPEGGWPNPD